MENAVLTEREREVALLAVKGYTAKRIAEELVVSEYTAKKPPVEHFTGRWGVVSKTRAHQALGSQPVAKISRQAEERSAMRFSPIFENPSSIR